MYLPEDILIQVLSRLPVKSLTRFRAVCKAWHSLVKSPTLVSKHLKNQTTSRLLVSHRDRFTNKRLVSMFTDDNLEELVNQNVPPFFNDKFGHIRLVGPSNGIVCLYGFPDNIALWNPATRDFKNVPISRIPRPPDAKVLGGDLAFGFDSKTNDYKVMQVLFCSPNKYKIAFQVEIYTLTTDSWTKYDKTIPATIMYRNVWSMLYGTEIFCWWAKDGDDCEIILSFDMANEEFQKTLLPSDMTDLGGEQRVTRAIVPMNGSIALIVYGLRQEKSFDIWVLNEFGVTESWTLLSTIGPLSGLERPLGFWKNGEWILENSSRELVLYDPRAQKVRNLGLQGKRDRLEILVYKESLVSLNNGNVSQENNF